MLHNKLHHHPVNNSFKYPICDNPDPKIFSACGSTVCINSITQNVFNQRCAPTKWLYPLQMTLVML